MKVTLLNGLYKAQKGHISIPALMNQIKTGVYAQAVFEVRKALALNGKKKYQKAKLQLPCFTPSGRFSQAYKLDGKLKRPVPPTKNNLIDYNGIVILDYDNLETLDLFALQEKVTNCEYTHASFCSPSNSGYKVLVRTSNKNPLKHAEVFNAVRAFYKDLTGLEDDKSSSNINRLCFVSVDAQLHYNEHSKVFEFQTKLFEKEEESASPISDIPRDMPMDKITKAVNRIESKGYHYVNGKRHEYVKQFSIECVKYGVSKAVCVGFVDANFISADCDANKVLKVVDWAYDNIKEVGIYEDWAKEQKVEKSKSENHQNTEGYVSDLYQESESKLETISIPQLKEEEIYELDEKVRKDILHQRLVEEKLAQYFEFRINTLKNREEYRQKGWKHFKEMTKIEYNSISRALKFHGISCSPNKLESIILSHFSKQVHPLKEMFEQWYHQHKEDKTDYIGQVARLVKTDAPKGLFDIIFRKWMVASIANLYVEETSTNHHCLILCGSEQGTNKTTFLSTLFSSEYTYTGLIDLKNKDSLIMLADTFIIILDEQFSILEKDKEWEALKSIITMPRVKARWHYAKNSKLAPRIANFCGTTNRIEILQDDTGNRRFIPFQVTKPIDTNALRKLDISKMWAQAYRLYKDGWRYLPTQKEKLQIEAYQKKFKKLDTHHRIISDTYEPCEADHPDAQLVSSMEMWSFLHKNFPLEKTVTVEKVGRAMSFLGFLQKRTIRDKNYPKRSRYWVCRLIKHN